MNELYIFGAQYLYLFAIAITLVFFVGQPRRRQKQILIFGISVAVASFLLAKLASIFYYDPRPFVESHILPLIPHGPDNGFPSDHTLLCAALASALFPFSRKASLALWLLTLAVGISRVNVGVHHLIDIVASVMIAIVAAILVYGPLKRVAKKYRIGFSAI